MYVSVLGRIIFFNWIRIRIIFVQARWNKYEYEYYLACGKIFEYIRMGSIKAFIHEGIFIEASIHKGIHAQRHVHKGINTSKGILWNLICLDLKWVRPEKRFIKIYWLMDWYLFWYNLQFLFPFFQQLESFGDFLMEIFLIIQHPCHLAVALFQ